jgi:3-hydroxyisobutyrate dehydrogenase-like beta-hydroxyacid dehydrogenase
MGAPMAANLLGHVDRLLVHDLSAEAVAALVAQGREAPGSAAALGERCEVVFTSLPTPPIVREAVRPKIVAGGTAHPLRPVDLRSQAGAGAARDALALRGRRQLRRAGLGRDRGAEQATISIMVGGPDDYGANLRSLLAAIGKPFYMGETPGAGQVMKLVNNLLGLAPSPPRPKAMALRHQGRARSGADDRGAQRRHRRQFGHPRQVAARGAAAHLRLRLCRPAQPQGHERC